MTTRCSSCILPGSFPNIEFNAEGVCNHCLELNESRCLGEPALEKVLEPYKKTGEKYNCIIPLSGGKDSSFVLYYAVKVLNLRPIALNYDSDFQSIVAKKNIKNICEALDVPFVIRKAGKISRKIIKQALLISEAVGSFFGICGNCEAILRSVSVNLAKEKNISLIIWGASSIENVEDEYVTKSNTVGLKGFLKNLKDVKKLFKTFPPLFSYYFLSVIQRFQMGIPKKYVLNIRRKIPFPENKIRVLYLFDYLKVDPQKMIEILKKEVKWTYPEDVESRFDCLLHPFINHHNLQLLGISSDGYVYSNRVRTGTLERSEALEKEMHIGNTVVEDCKSVINELGLKDYKMPALKEIGE